MTAYTAMFRDFRGFREAEIVIGEGVTVLVGPNGSGKTSLLNGVAAVLCEHPKIYNATKGGSKVEIISAGSGAEHASVMVGRPEGFAIATWPEMKLATSGKPPFPTTGGIAGGLVSPRRLEKRSWQQFLAKLAKLEEPNDKELEQALVDAGEKRAKVAEILKDFDRVARDWDAAVDGYRERATKAKGAWRQITGEDWGDKKGRDWKAPAAQAIAPDLRTRYDAAGAECDRLRGEVQQKSQEFGAMPDGQAGFTGNCPACGVVLALEDKKFVEHTAGDDANLAEQRKLKAAARAKLDQLAQAQQKAHTTMLELRGQIGAAQQASARGAEDENSAQDVDRQIRRYLALADFFGPAGFRHARMRAAIKPLNDQLAELGAALFGKDAPTPTIRTDLDGMPLMLGGRTFDSIAWNDDFNSSGLRLQYMLQILAWKRLGGDLVLMDRGDTLEPGNRTRLLKVLKVLNVPTLVAFTSDQVEKAAGLVDAGLATRVYAIRSGAVELLADAQMEAEAA